MRIFLIIALILAAIAVICVAASTAIFGIGGVGWLIFSWFAALLNKATNEYRLGPPIG
jgi:hypothetical protein